jgi:acyl carrier protein
LRGVFHLAVSTDGVLISELNRERLEGVLRPKAGGAWTLHSLTEGLPLDFFVLFSSVACVLSQPGQGSYAVANAYLDGLARYRRERGLKASSIQWGPWTGVGLARDEGALRSVRAYQEQGVRSLPLPVALEALASLLRENVTNNLVLPVRWNEFSRSFAGDKVPRLFLDLAAAASPATGAELPKESVRDKLLTVPAGRARRALLEDHLQKVLAAVLKADASKMDPTKPLGSLGVDSLMALQFVRRLAVTTSVHLPATAVFNYPTLRALETELARRMEIPLDSETQAAPAFSTPDVTFAESSGVADLSEEEAMSALLNDGGKK